MLHCRLDALYGRSQNDAWRGQGIGIFRSKPPPLNIEYTIIKLDIFIILEKQFTKKQKTNRKITYLTIIMNKNRKNNVLYIQVTMNKQFN